MVFLNIYNCVYKTLFANPAGFAYIHTYIHTNLRAYVRVYVRVYVYMYVYVCMCVHVCAYVSIGFKSIKSS